MQGQARARATGTRAARVRVGEVMMTDKTWVLSKSGIKVRGISRKGSPRSSSAPLFSVLSPSYPSLPRFPLPFPPILPSLSLPSSPAHTIPPSFLTSGRADACFTDYLSADPCDPKEAVGRLSSPLPADVSLGHRASEIRLRRHQLPASWTLREGAGGERRRAEEGGGRGE
eukprot:714792-Hanusia_phi.AAC.1